MESLSTSKLTMIQLALKVSTSSADENMLWAVNSLTVRGDKMWTKNFAKLYVGLLTADKMGRKEGQLSMIELRTLALP